MSCGPHPEPLVLHPSCFPLPGWWPNTCRHLHLSGLPSRSGREGSGDKGKPQSPGPGHSWREDRIWGWPPQAGASMQMSYLLHDIISDSFLWWLSFHGLDQAKGPLHSPGIVAKYLFKVHMLRELCCPTFVKTLLRVSRTSTASPSSLTVPEGCPLWLPRPRHLSTSEGSG